jgi:hypothetical protein
MAEVVSRVPVDAVLECLRQLLAEHASRVSSPEESPATLIAIALDERQRFNSLLRETLRVANGLLVDATTCGAGVKIEAGDESRLTQLNDAVEATLESYNKVEAGASLVLKFEDGWAKITGSTPYDVANAAQRSIRELLTALYHSHLRGGPLAGLVWADDALDEQHRKIAWPLLMRLPSLLGRPTNSTLLLFAGDTHLYFDLHCAGDPSLDGRITTSGFERRRKYASSSESIMELAMQSAEDAPLVVIFLGAGASVVEGLPTGNELRDKALARQVGLTRVDQGNFQDAARSFFRKLRSGERLRAGEDPAGEDSFVSTLTLERILLEEQAQENQLDCHTVRSFRRDHAAIIAALTDARGAGKFVGDPLLELLERRRRLVLVTVNFDRVLEIKAGDAVRAYIEENELAQVPDYLRTYKNEGGPVPLIKLHGDIDNPESIVVNIEETAGGLSAARLEALEGIVRVMKEQSVRPWWFVGYSMRDLDLEAHWQSAVFADTMVEHWVAPFADPSVAKFISGHRQPRWDRKSFSYRLENRMVTLTASDFFKVLLQQTSGRW